MRCRACFGGNLEEFVDLGWQPPSNDFSLQIDRFGVISKRFYSLKMMVCEDCGLGQLSEIVDPGEIFSDYMYFSSQSPSWVEDRRRLADRMINEFKLDKASLVVDIGSNDGYYLKHFVARNVGVVGYEPAENVAEVARAAGVPTHTEFWGEDTHALGADLINATNVLAHTPDMDGFIAGIAAALLSTGVATLEFPLFSNLIDNSQLDTIYHEHYSYISIHALRRVLTRHELRIWRIEQLDTHGGSVRVFVCHDKARYLEEESVDRVARKERWAPDVAFQQNASLIKFDALKFLASVWGEGSIVGYGAPAKATVFCNYLGLDNSIIDYVVDDSPYKQGKNIPGTNIPIVSFDHHMDAPRPDYIVVFAWNLLTPIAAKLKQAYKDRSIYHMPSLVTFIPKLSITKI